MSALPAEGERPPPLASASFRLWGQPHGLPGRPSLIDGPDSTEMRYIGDQGADTCATRKDLARVVSGRISIHLQAEACLDEPQGLRRRVSEPIATSCLLPRVYRGQVRTRSASNGVTPRRPEARLTADPVTISPAE